MNSYLIFSSGGVRLAISLRCIREIVPCDTITRVPHVPSFVRGVVNLRGDLLPVVDLSLRFGLETDAPGAHACLMVVDIGNPDESSAVGFIVDAVENVVALGDEAIEAAPSFGLPIDAGVVRGIATVANRIMIVLDIERVLSALEEAMAANVMEAAR